MSFVTELDGAAGRLVPEKYQGLALFVERGIRYSADGTSDGSL